uniref:Coat protein n=1 Tax=Bremia lactucae associated ssRNA 2 TaxID=2719812 RepID=A0A6G9EM88_9VIRU|nr:MAG: coat protein [Bremia lactucae associated ssRNA 2]
MAGPRENLGFKHGFNTSLRTDAEYIVGPRAGQPLSLQVRRPQISDKDNSPVAEDHEFELVDGDRVAKLKNGAYYAAVGGKLYSIPNPMSYMDMGVRFHEGNERTAAMEMSAKNTRFFVKETNIDLFPSDGSVGYYEPMDGGLECVTYQYAVDRVGAGYLFTEYTSRWKTIAEENSDNVIFWRALGLGGKKKKGVMQGVADFLTKPSKEGRQIKSALMGGAKKLAANYLGPLGEQLVDTAAKKLESHIKTISGSGDYEINAGTSAPLVNSLMKGDHGHFLKDGDGVRMAASKGYRLVSQSEKIASLYSNSTGAFQIASFAVDPADTGTFPMLAQAAEGYSRFEFEGLAFESKSRVGLLQTNLGASCFAVRDDPTLPAFKNLNEMQGTRNQVSDRGDRNLLHFIECAREMGSSGPLYINNALVPNGTLTTTQFTKCTEYFGFTSTGVTANLLMYDIWVHYTVRLYFEEVPRPMFGYAHLGYSGCTSVLPLGTAQTRSQAYGCLDTTGASPSLIWDGSSLTVTKAREGEIYRFRCIWSQQGASAIAGVTAAASVSGGSVDATIWNSTGYSNAVTTTSSTGSGPYNNYMTHESYWVASGQQVPNQVLGAMAVTYSVLGGNPPGIVDIVVECIGRNWATGVGAGGV